jgi:hypothetical protein
MLLARLRHLLLSPNGLSARPSQLLRLLYKLL